MRSCNDCPLRWTELCHNINPMAKKYTRSEKEELREVMNKGQTAFKEAK